MLNSGSRALLGGSMLVMAMTLANAASAQSTDTAAERTTRDEGDDILVTGLRDVMSVPTNTGSRLGLTPFETPASIAVVGGDAIRARGDSSVVDAVTRAPGITSVANPGNGDTALAARGFSGQGSVLQLVDGVRLFPVAGTITFPSDPWNIARIEVLSGPASVLYGQGSLGGAVNVVTKEPNGERNEFQAEAGYGSQNTVHLAAGAGGPIGPTLSYRVDASYRRSDGNVDRGDSENLALSAALRFAPSSSFVVTLRNDYGNAHPTKYFGTPLIAGRLNTSIRDESYNVSDAVMHFKDNRTSLSLDWNITPSLTFGTVAYYLTSKRMWRNLESYCWVAANGDCPNGYNGSSQAPGTIYRTDNLGIVHDQRQWGDQTTLKLNTPFGGGISNDLVVGADFNLIGLTYSHDFGSAVQESPVNPTNFNPGLFLDTQGIAPRYRTRTLEWSLFAENRFKLSNALSVVAGVRTERDEVSRYTFVYDADGTRTETPALNGGTRPTKTLENTTWRVGAVYQPAKNISLYAQYSTGVDPLGTLATYSGSASQFFYTNATGDQIEAGVKASFLDGRGSATVAGYRIVKRNLVAQRTPTSPVEQIGQRSSEGIEVSVALQLPAGFGVDANAAVLRARYDDFISGGTSYSGKVPTGIPQAMGNLWLSWNTRDKFAVRAGLRYVGHSYSNDANTFRVPGYAVIDGGASYAITSKVALDVHAYNLLNKDYAITTYNDEQWILGRPRSIDVSVRAKF
jgi:iron complex outermembrane receptor protein